MFVTNFNKQQVREGNGRREGERVRDFWGAGEMRDSCLCRFVCMCVSQEVLVVVAVMWYWLWECSTWLWECGTWLWDVVPGYGNVVPGYGNVAPGYGNVVPGYGNVVHGYGNVVPGYGNDFQCMMSCTCSTFVLYRASREWWRAFDVQ